MSKVNCKTLPELSDRDKERFLSYIQVGGLDECWTWMHYRNDQGYGIFYWGNRPRLYRRAHRISFHLHYGVDPGPLLVCHRCDNRPCCNPAHLFIGTQMDNMSDACSKGRLPIGRDRWQYRMPERVPRGAAHIFSRHPELVARGENQGTAKLTEANVREIRGLLASGDLAQAEIGKLFSVSDSNISAIKCGRSWAWLK